MQPRKGFPDASPPKATPHPGGGPGADHRPCSEGDFLPSSPRPHRTTCQRRTANGTTPNERTGESLMDLDFDAFQRRQAVAPYLRQLSLGICGREVLNQHNL
ncbi:unnamed protein product [Arctogadus glacialis]